MRRTASANGSYEKTSEAIANFSPDVIAMPISTTWSAENASIFPLLRASTPSADDFTRTISASVNVSLSICLKTFSVVVARPTPIFLPLNAARSRNSLPTIVMSDAPVTKVSCVKSTRSDRARVFVVGPQRMSILFPTSASKRLLEVTGTYSTVTSLPSLFLIPVATRLHRSMM